MKAVGYVRVSTEDQSREGVSLEAQEAKIRAWADLNGYDEVVIFTDAGISGSSMDKREALHDALDAVGKGDVLVVYALSRLARSRRTHWKSRTCSWRRAPTLSPFRKKLTQPQQQEKWCFGCSQFSMNSSATR